MTDDKTKKQVIDDLKSLLPDLFDKDTSFSMELFKSKKNSVYHIIFKKKPAGFPKEVVVKRFNTSNAEREHDALVKLIQQSLFVPKVIFFKAPYLILEKIEGDNLCDSINDTVAHISKLNELDAYSRDRLLFSIKKLSNWIAQLHKHNILSYDMLTDVIVLNKGDTILRDFVLSSANDEVYGFDFEECYEGNHIDDLAWICCSLLDTTPGILDEPDLSVLGLKIDLINTFLAEYYRINKKFKFNFNYFAEKLLENLNIVIERRASFGIIDKQKILRNLLGGF